METFTCNWWHNFNLKLFWFFLFTTGHTFNKDTHILHIGRHKRLGVPIGVLTTHSLYYWWTADYFPPLIIWWNHTISKSPFQCRRIEDSAFQVESNFTRTAYFITRYEVLYNKKQCERWRRENMEKYGNYHQKLPYHNLLLIQALVSGMSVILYISCLPCPSLLQLSVIFLKTSSLWSRRDTERYSFMSSVWVTTVWQPEPDRTIAAFCFWRVYEPCSQ